MTADSLTLLTETYTDRDGSFTLNLPRNIAFNRYLLTVTRPGFVSHSEMLGACEFPTDARVFTLTKREISEPTDESVQTGDAARRKIIGPPLATQLPLSGFRDFDDLTLLVTGAAAAPQTTRIEGPPVSPTVGTLGIAALNGLRSRENNFTVDGSDNNDEMLGVRRQGFVNVSPQPVESIEEFQVLTAVGGVQYGRATAGQINVQTRSGEFDWHGDAFGFFTGDALGARDFFFQNIRQGPAGPPLVRKADNVPILLDSQPVLTRLPASGKAPFTRSDAGAAAGGPWRKQRLFFFGAYERRNSNGYGEQHFAVPTLAQRGMNTLGGGPGDVGFISNRVLNPIPDQFLPGPVALASASLPGDGIFSLYPLPNNLAGPYGDNTYTAPNSDYARGRLYTFKAERLIGASGSISARFNRTSEHSVLPVTGNALDSAIAPRVLNQNLALYFTPPRFSVRGFGSNPWVSLTRISFGRTGMDFSDVGARSPLKSDFFPKQEFLVNAPLVLNLTRPNLSGTLGQPQLVTAASPQGAALMRALGLPGVVHSEAITGPLGQVEIGGFSPVGVDVFRFPQRRADHTAQIANHSSNSFGRHSVAFGLDWRRVTLGSNLNRNARPLAEFHGTYGGLVAGCDSCPPYLLPATALAAAGTTTRMLQTLTSSAADDDLSLHANQLDFYVTYGFTAGRLHLESGFRLGINGMPGGLDNRVANQFNETAFQSLLDKAESDCEAFASLPNAPIGPPCPDRLTVLRKTFPGNFSDVFGADRIGNDARFGFAWDALGNSKLAVRGGFGSYTGVFPAIAMSESRSAFPSALPLNMPNGPGYYTHFLSGPLLYKYLANLANPTVRALDPQLQDFIQTNSLNRLTTDAASDPVNVLGNRLNNLYPILTPTWPATRLKHPYSFQWGLTIEGEVSPGAVVSLAYVGTRGVKLLRETTPDPAYRTQVGAAGFPLVYNPDVPIPYVVTDLFPIAVARQQAPNGDEILPPYFNEVTVSRTLLESSATSIYHSVQLEVRKRYARGLEIGAGFVYSHAIDDSSDFFDTAGEFALPQNSEHQSERGSSAFDARLRGSGFFLYDLPKFTGAANHTPAWAKVFAGWQASGIWMAQSGQPYTINTSIDVNLDDNTTDRLNSTAGLLFHPVPGDRSRQVTVRDPSALLAPIGQNGLVGRNTFTGDPLSSVDLALTKAVPLGSEKRRADLRVEGFNVLNRAAFGVPVRIVESPGFGSSAATLNHPRSIQFALKIHF